MTDETNGSDGSSLTECRLEALSEGNRLTESTLKPAYIRKIRFRNLVVPAVSIVGILFVLSGNTWSSAIYMTLPIVFYGVEYIFG